MRHFLTLPLTCVCALVASMAATQASPADASTHNEQVDALATLRLEATSGGYLAWADNRLDGPIEVRLESLANPAPTSQPTLPARASVPALGSSLLLAQADAPIEQGFEGQFSHQDVENRYALDFSVPVGTPVLAAREGVVMQVQVQFHGHGLDYAHDAGRANFIRILHTDGSMALYAHLAENGALVHPGQHVETGQRIGLSGNTGYSTAPHLHFAVQVNRSMQLTSIPFRLAKP